MDTRALLKTGPLLAAFLLAPHPAAADTFGFNCVTFNDPNEPFDCDIAESQISLEVTDPNTTDDKIRMTISNAGPANSSVR